MDEDVNLDILRALDEHVDGKHRLLVTTDASLGLRSLDYRSYDSSITFVTLRQFRNYREMMQASMRV